jgi:hypothetical protein
MGAPAVKILFVCPHDADPGPAGYYQYAQFLGHEVDVCGPGHQTETLEGVFRRHADFDLVLVFASDAEPDLARARARGMTTAYYVREPEARLRDHLRLAPGYDFVFCPQKVFMAPLRGVNPATFWLPPSADHRRFRPYEVAETHDVVFVGDPAEPGREVRRELLQKLQQHVSVEIVRDTSVDVAARAYRAARMVFNESRTSEVNPEIFEALATGAFVVTNRSQGTGLTELLRHGKELVLYKDGDDLIKVVQKYRKLDEIRRKIADRGRERVMARHTHAHRVGSILTVVETNATAGRDLDDTPDVAQG